MIKSNETFTIMGTSEFHEKLTFVKPAPAEIINNIQSYCNDLVCRLNNQTEDENIKVDSYLVVDGIRADITDTNAFIEASEKLGDVKCFELDTILDAHYISSIYSADTDSESGTVNTWLSSGLESYLYSVKDTADFEYKKIAYHANSGAISFIKISDGVDIDIDSLATTEFPLTAKNRFSWSSVNLAMGYYRDDITDAQAAKIQSIVRKYIPEDEVQYCESDWEDCNDVILSGVYWDCEDLTKVVDFLNELNEVVVLPEEDWNQHKPEADETNTWYDMQNFAIAFFAEIDGKFVLLGTDF